ncbi:MAG: DUF4388 domain-containing protein [Desulfobacteraceae bacterium]
MSEKLEGKITGINLTNFLQIVQMEKPTVTLLIAKGSKKGALFIENGEIIDAETKSGLRHLDAAYEIISWDDSSIELKKEMPKTERIIKMPLMNILMEALRLKDEKPQSSEEEEEIEDIEITVEDDEDVLAENFPAEDGENNQAEPELEFDEDFLSGSGEKIDDLDAISFDPDDYTPVSADKSYDKETEQAPDIPDREIIPDKKEDILESYDIGAQLDKKSPVKDFTDHIVLPKSKDEKKGSAEEKTAPSIEDFIEKKSPWKKIAVFSVIFMILVSCLGAGGYIYLKNKKIEQEYSQLLKNLEKLDYEDQKISVLKKFISAYQGSDYAEKARNTLDTILKRSQKESFQIMTQKVDKLPIDDEYKERAERYYQNFLQRFPEGEYAQKTKNLLDKVPQIVKDYELSKIKAIPDSETERKISELEGFSKKYPEVSSDEIEKIKNQTGDYYLSSIQKEIDKVDSLEKFEDVKNKIESFGRLFPRHPDNYKTSRLSRTLEDEKWAFALLNSAKKHSSSIEQEKQFLKDYIRIHNRYKLVNAVNTRIREIDYILSEKQKFENIMEYASNESYSYENRINRLKAYIHSDIAPEYKQKSEQKLSRLETDYLKTRKIPRKKETPEKAETPAKAIDINDMIRASSSKAASAAQKLSGSSRFFMHGKFSFKDSLTGKTWMILDSDDFSDKDCHYFKDAQETVKKINIDGYSDWRLPTEQELLSLYKNRPFFPIEKNKWFWSGDVFEKGFNTYSAAITDRQTEKREKLSKDIFSECGIFKAVRP